MSRLKLPVAAAGIAAAVVLGGVYAGGALADEGDGGSSSLPADPSATTPADAGTDVGAGTDAGTDAGAGSGTPGDTGTASDGGTATDSGTAADSGTAGDSMEVSPATVAPGGQVTLRLRTSCTVGHQAKASATVFVSAVTLAPGTDGGELEANAFIRSDAADGSYTISVQCDGVKSSASASITVITSGGVPTTPTTPLTPATPLVPLKPVPAGGGGTAQLAAGPAAAGTSSGPLLATGAFAAAGLAGAAVRRSRRSGGRG